MPICTPGLVLAIVGVPVADQDALDGQQLAALGGLDEREVEVVEVDGEGIGEPGLACDEIEQVAMVGGVLLDAG